MSQDFVKYGFALLDSKDGKVVWIDSLSRETSSSHKFYCPHCHREMYPTFGPIQVIANTDIILTMLDINGKRKKSQPDLSGKLCDGKNFMNILKSLIIWICFIPAAILNGGLREYVLAPAIGSCHRAEMGLACERNHFKRSYLPDYVAYVSTTDKKQYP